MNTDRAFSDQITDHIPALRKYARVLRRHQDQADDLTQDCIERALAKSCCYAVGTNLRAWLFTIMRNIFITQLRREAFQQRSKLHYGARSLATVEPRQDVVVELKECIARTSILSAFERRIVRHMCFDDLSYEETARRIGKPIGTIKSRLSRARRTLRASVAQPAAGGLAERQTIDHVGAGAPIGG